MHSKERVLFCRMKAPANRSSRVWMTIFIRSRGSSRVHLRAGKDCVHCKPPRGNQLFAVEACGERCAGVRSPLDVASLAYHSFHFWMVVSIRSHGSYRAQFRTNKSCVHREPSSRKQLRDNMYHSQGCALRIRVYRLQSQTTSRRQRVVLFSLPQLQPHHPAPRINRIALNCSP